jgi:hypothetical protein
MKNIEAEHLRLLKLVDIESFLSTSGWTKKAANDYASVWKFRDSEILMPAQEARDYFRRVREAIAELSTVMAQTEEAVFRQILASGFKLLKISSVGARSSDGTVSFEAGCKLLMSVRDLLLASASAVVEPRRMYTGKRSDLVSSFIDDARLGQTEHGSFVWTVLAPIVQKTEAILPGIAPETPFGEQVVTKLLDATKLVRQAAERTDGGSDWFATSFVPLVEKGVSANLCAALCNMLEVDGTEKIVLSTSSFSDGASDLNVVELPATLNERLSQAAVEFRKDPPLDNVLIEGTTTSFRRESMTKMGRVSMKGMIGGERRRVSFNLPAKEYDIFLEAHKIDRPISLRADLKKSGTSYEATIVHEFHFQAGRDLFLDTN